MLVAEMIYRGALEEIEEGNIKLARKDLTQIITDYPASKEAVLARELLSSLKDGDSQPRSPSELTEKLLPKKAASYPTQKTVTASSNYSTARSISKLISFIGWLVVVIGVICVGAFFGTGGILGVLPGIAIAISGLVLVAAGQVTQATVDNADHTRAILFHLTQKNL